MEKKKEHLPKEVRWVIRIIESCKTPRQMELCDKLVDNYSKIYNNDHIEQINETFHKKAIQTNYYQHKAVINKEKLK